jgi:CRP-like cAMP-binding protein
LQKYGKKPVSLAPPSTPSSGSKGGESSKFWKPQVHKKILTQRRQAITVEYLSDDMNDEAMKGRQFHKTGHERALILQALRDCAAFNIMDDQALSDVCNIMWESNFKADEKICTEGTVTSLFHVLVDGALFASTSDSSIASPNFGPTHSLMSSSSSGQFTSFSLGGIPASPSRNTFDRDSNNTLTSSPSYTQHDSFKLNTPGGNKDTVLSPGQFFGETALLYDQPFTHTISATEPSRCFTLNRLHYKKLLASASSRIYTQRTNFLRAIPLFTNANNDLITQVAEALEIRYIKSGQEIIREGQQGDEFYILEHGRCTATSRRSIICVYQRPGDFFGELALLHNQPRACTVTADVDCKVLYLSQVDFNLFKPHLEPHLLSRIGLYQPLSGNNERGQSGLTPLSALGPIDDDDDDDVPPPPPPPPMGFDEPLGQIYDDAPPPPPPPPPMDNFYIPTKQLQTVTAPKPLLFDSDTDDDDDDEDDEQTITIVGGGDDDDDGYNQNDAEFRIMTMGSQVGGVQNNRGSTAMAAFPQANSLRQEEAPTDLPTLGTISYDQRFSQLQTQPPPSNTANYNPDSVEARLKMQNNIFGDKELPVHMQRLSVLPQDPTALANKKRLYDYGNGPNHVCTVTDLKDLDIIGTLGRGTFGHVQLVKDKHEHIYALKAVNKAHVVTHNQVPHILNERATMLELDHPFIVKLYRTLKDRDFLYFLLEPSLGGELFTVLRNAEHFDNNTARFYAAIVVTVFQYIHGKDILYRDLKPENLLMDADGYIRVTDFGFAKKTKERTYTFCGTPDYLAPEIVASAGHHTGADWWCLGILIYEMLAGYTPFYDENGPGQMYNKILGGKVFYPPSFCSEAKDIVSNLLQTKPTRRLGVILGGADVIRNHSWFAGLDWDKLLKRELPSPIPVTIKSKFDLGNFDAYDDEGTNDPFVVDPKNPWDEVF